MQILVIEDNVADFILTKEAFEECRNDIVLDHAINGKQALTYLSEERCANDNEKPDLILLDLNLPVMDGCSILAELKKNNDVKHIPVIILSSSEANEDIVKSYNLGANCYLVKPVGYANYCNLIKSLNIFWLGKAKLPGQSLPRSA